MNEENSEKLINTFKFFPQSYSKNGHRMTFGISCGDGWFKLLWDLCEGIEKLGFPESFRVAQVKEKFGGLRFYCDSSTKLIDSLIDKAEHKSNHTCEDCGEPGESRGGGWVKTLCDTHAVDRNGNIKLPLKKIRETHDEK